MPQRRPAEPEPDPEPLKPGASPFVCSHAVPRAAAARMVAHVGSIIHDQQNSLQHLSVQVAVPQRRPAEPEPEPEPLKPGASPFVSPTQSPVLLQTGERSPLLLDTGAAAAAAKQDAQPDRSVDSSAPHVCCVMLTSA